MSFKRYLTNKLSNEKVRLSNLLSSTHLPYKKQLSQVLSQHKSYTAEQLPSTIDLRADMTPIEDQSRSGSSVANCLAGAYEYLIKKCSGCNIVVSRLFIYYNARMKASNSSSINDSGCSVTDAIEALKEFGTCLESRWPYDISHVNTCPTEEAYEQAEQHKINKAYHINLDLIEMKSCLAQGFLFAFGLKIYTSFDRAAKTGIVPVPSVWEQQRRSNGSHALLAVGYSDQSNAFIVRNSWGEDWGDKGYCYIPYDYMTNPDLCFDVWSIRKVENSDFGREYWHFDDIVDYLKDNSHENDHEVFSPTSYRRKQWRSCITRTNGRKNSWEEYRGFREDYSRYDDDYRTERSRRDRYDRDNETFDPYLRGYTNCGYSSNRYYSSSVYDRYQDDSSYYKDYGYDRLGHNQQRFMF